VSIVAIFSGKSSYPQISQIIAAARIYLNMPRRPETAPAPHRSLDAAAIIEKS